MTKCPSCFQDLPADRFVWICQSDKCESGPDADASRYAGVTVSSSTMVREARPSDARRNWQPSQGGSCPGCSEPMAEACPHCHFALISGWRNSQVTCIAMNGARTTGKSLYIAVAIKQLQQLALRMGTVLQFANDRTRLVYTEIYEQPLYVERGLMAPTARATVSDSYHREPLIFSLGMVKGMRRFVVIRDVAGEEMENPPAQTGHLQFLAHADAVLFMFDPLAVPEVRAKLVDLVPAQLLLGGDPVVVLGNLLNLVGANVPRLGIVLSKFDALHELRRVDDLAWRSVMSNAGAAFLRDPSQDSVEYDEADGALLHEEVKSLLYRLGGTEVVLTLENPQSGHKVPFRFFAVSALGESPDGRELHSRGIAPFRCLDPLKWALTNTGVL